ncbi:MAG: T9SS type A sorting domain-containing protein [Saprospiraceae bacterium]|nr:T9SS type A sorting domain-containing protein [Saprospiraceae bacterium]
MNTRLFNTTFWALLLGSFLSLSGELKAQGFIRQYPFFTWLEGGAHTVYPRADGSFRLTASSYPDFGVEIGLLWLDTDAQGQLTGGDTSQISVTANAFFQLENGQLLTGTNDTGQVTLQRIAADGSVLWTRAVPFPDTANAVVVAIKPSAAGDVFVRGYYWVQYTSGSTIVTQYTGFLAKTDAAGNLLWQTTFPFDLTYVIAHSLEPMADGGCVLANHYWDGVTDASVLRFGNTGDLLWSYHPQDANLFVPQVLDHGLAVDDDLSVRIPVQSTDAGPVNVYIDFVGPDGHLQVRTNITAATGWGNITPQASFVTSDGGCLAVYERYFLNDFINHVVRVAPNGDVMWVKTLSPLSNAMLPAGFTDGLELSDGSLVLYGLLNNNLYLIKMDGNGTIYPHSLTGTVVRDSTFNCALDPFDPPFKDWVVKASANGQNYLSTTGPDGHYLFTDLDTGAYTVQVVLPSYLWAPCTDSVNISLQGSAPQTDTVDFAIQSLYDCPLMQIDLSTPIVRRCLAGSYYLHYCNAGNQPASPVVIELEIDPLIQIDSASAPYTQDGNLLTFQAGTVAPGECDDIIVYYTVDCEAELGQTICAEAHIFPDTICADNLPGWSGAIVEVDAACDGDSVQFSIRNTGLAPSQTLDFIIVDDHVITRSGTFSLPPGGTRIETAPADGSTWRLIAQQEPGYPFGPQMPSVAVEACTAPPGSPFSMGMVNMFPNFTGNPFEDIDCKTVVGSYDPNDKQAFPLGVDEQHLIEQNQPIEYQIRFQNTGSDTAFTVVVRDTLSAWLDPTSIRPGAASHAYDWTVSGQGVVQFTFNDILLPDSNVNEAASHGFVQFWINQKPNVPLGSVIENRAGIYFDFNEPVITNTVFHTVGHNFLPLSAPPAQPTLADIRLEPNPAWQITRLSADRPLPQGLTLVVRDARGRLVGTRTIQEPSTEIYRNGLPSGLYFVELRNGNGLVAVSKLIWTE